MAIKRTLSNAEKVSRKKILLENCLFKYLLFSETSVFREKHSYIRKEKCIFGKPG